MDLNQHGLETGDEVTKSKSHAGPSSSQNCWRVSDHDVNPPLEGSIHDMSFEETMSSTHQFLAQDAQYPELLQPLQDTVPHEKGPAAIQPSDLAIQRQPAMSCNLNPEQSNRKYGKDERKREKKRKKGAAAARAEAAEEAEERRIARRAAAAKQRMLSAIRKRKSVSRPLMDKLWAKFKSNNCPSARQHQSLSLEFGLTDKQISQWFNKMRKKYNKEMSN